MILILCLKKNKIIQKDQNATVKKLYFQFKNVKILKLTSFSIWVSCLILPPDSF